MIIALVIYLLCCYATWSLFRKFLKEQPNYKVDFLDVFATICPIFNIWVMIELSTKLKAVNWKKFFRL
ncbi:hypothetical protein [Bacillus mycoides]|uniref:hypothetical protein n=1 Tax=Bacillus mycoides TaxID=1405 RepID=UPI003D660B7C